MSEKYVRESVLVDPMPEGPFIRLYNYKGMIFDAGLFAAYYGNAKKSRNMFIMNLHKANDIPMSEALSISHDFYDSFNDLHLAIERGKIVYPSNVRCPRCESMYVVYNPKAWFSRYQCSVCNKKWKFA